MEKEWCDACYNTKTDTYTFTCIHNGYEDNVPYERKGSFILCYDCMMTLLEMIKEHRESES